MNNTSSVTLDLIRIEKLLVHGTLGLHDWERKNEQDILIDLTLHVTGVPDVAATDDVRRGVNYSDVVRRVMTHVQASERFTVEALVTDIAGLCLGFDPVQRVTVRVSKPAAERFAGSVAVEVDRARDMLLTPALIGIGSNTDAERNLRDALARLSSVGDVVAVSTVYESPAIGQNGPHYLNAVVRVDTCLPAAEIRRMLKAIEADMGRTDDAKAAGRVPIDLDLCLLGPQVIRNRDASIPDPALLSREYLARGCAEVLPDARHPETGEPLTDVARRLAGTSQLRARPDVRLEF
jgi:2-amino-4-hydroxy-6-hydroxymethyldihydropteridine diphosphokinase